MTFYSYHNNDYEHLKMMADDGSTQYFGWGGEAFGGLETVADLGFEFGGGQTFSR